MKYSYNRVAKHFTFVDLKTETSQLNSKQLH